MSTGKLVLLSKQFSIDIIKLYDVLTERKKVLPVIGQLLRSGTSIGANIHEANYAASKADFINKLQIALKECYETDYWLDIFHSTLVISDEEYTSLFASCCKIRKLLITSLNTIKQNPSDL